MTNPSSRLTKFRLTLEEYDFTVNYVKGKENVTADALSRISIDSDDLKNINSARVNVVTRAQMKKLNSDSKEMFSNSQKNERLDHPGVVELLKIPKECVQLSPINKNDFNKMLKEDDKNISRYRNFIYNSQEKIIYVQQDTRSTSIFGASLRDLSYICNKYGINELVILRKNNAHCSMLLDEVFKVKNEIKKTGIKINIIKANCNITDKETRQLILNDFHMLPTGGHCGINRMYNNIKKYYFWSSLRKDIEKFVTKCDDCQRHKYSIQNRQPLVITTTAESALQEIYLDLVGPLETDQENNRYILTLQCELSKFVEAYPIKNKESTTVAKSFVDNFILRYGIPKEIVTDQGTEFLSSIFKDTCKLLNINQLNSTAYHHETLGSLENSHKNLGAYLRIYCAKQIDNWSSWIPYWCFNYNNTVHSETKYTPYELVFGKAGRLPSNVFNDVEPVYNFDDYPFELKYRLQKSWEDAKNNLIASKEKRKIFYDGKYNCKKSVMQPGDKIFIKNETGNKFDEVYKGPYVVVKIEYPNVIVKINDKLSAVHMNRTKLFRK